MNKAEQTAAYAWLLNLAEYAHVPEHVGDNGRACAVELVSTALSQLSEPLTQKRVVITHTELEGEYGAA